MQRIMFMAVGLLALASLPGPSVAEVTSLDSVIGEQLARLG